jgi:hypothetical protein
MIPNTDAQLCLDRLEGASMNFNLRERDTPIQIFLSISISRASLSFNSSLYAKQILRDELVWPEFLGSKLPSMKGARAGTDSEPSRNNSACYLVA